MATLATVVTLNGHDFHWSHVHTIMFGSVCVDIAVESCESLLTPIIAVRHCKTQCEDIQLEVIVQITSPWHPRCERPGSDGSPGSLLPTGLASIPWQYPAGVQWGQIEWPEAYWSEWLLGFDESIPQETEIPWPERLQLHYLRTDQNSRRTG